MNKEFFKANLGKRISVDYKIANKDVFTIGEITDVEDEFVTITNDDCVVCVKYSSITAIRILTNGGKH